MNEHRSEITADLIEQAVAWRRDIHAHPELAYNERRTAELVATQLVSFGLKVHRGLGGTGVVGTLSRGTSRRSIAIRADMDALAMEEQSGATYASNTRGVMHACGHDGHVAIALAAARVCAGLPDLDGTVHFVFQPAEEGSAGARKMVEDGLFRLFPVDAVYALHNWPGLQLGACVARDGAMMAANAVFEVLVRGRGAHAAMPHLGRDPVLAACHLVTALHTIVSRSIDPLQSCVVSAAQIRAGEAHNVIPESCFVRGSVRWYDDRVGDLIEGRFADMVRSIPAGFGCEGTLRYERRYPATINAPSAAARVRGIVQRLPRLSLVDAEPSMASEDFAFMLQAVPGCYLWLGAGSEHGLHSPFYDFNDELIPLGAALWVSLIGETLARH